MSDLGLLYTLYKDFRAHLKEKNAPVKKMIRAKDIANFENKWKKLGYKVYWSYPDRIEEREQDGWRILYEPNKVIGKTCYFTTVNDGLIFIVKK